LRRKKTVRRSLPQAIAERILTDHIDGGRVAAGERLPTVSTLEGEYGVSRSTVVHALGILEQQGWVERRHGSGCFVTGGPARDENANSRLIAFIANYCQTELMLLAYNGIEATCLKHGIQVLVANSQHDIALEREHLNRSVGAGCEAAIIVPVTRRKSQIDADYLLTEHLAFPIVLLDIAYPQQRRIQVVFDNYQCGYAMTEMLVSEGHKRIAFMDADHPDDPYMHYSTRERYRGYRDALVSAGLSFHHADRWILGDHLPIEDVAGAVLPFLMTWRSDTERATALIAIDDATAVPTIQMARRLGIAVPDDLRVTGFDDTVVGRSQDPPIPTTAADFRHAGELAAQLAIRQIGAAPPAPQVYVLPAPVVHRQATFHEYEHLLAPQLA
jgi:DNA-binding LacI/PurR family transcriptional regulator